MKSSVLFGLAVAAAAIVATGCCSSKAGNSGGGDSVQEAYLKWQQNRAPIEQVTSQCPDPEAKAIIDGVAIIPGKLYKYLADGADGAFAIASGRDIYNGVTNDMAVLIKEGKDVKAELFDKMPEKDREALWNYHEYVKKQDFKSTKEKLDGIAKQLGEDSGKVAGALAAVKNCKFDGMNMLQKAGAIKTAASEIDTIRAQLADCLKANKYWSDLNAQDEAAQKLMQEYKVEK